MRHPTTRSRLLLGSTFSLALAVISAGSGALADEVREARHETLQFMVGNWATLHEVPAGEGKTTPVRGEASIRWDVGESWLHHDFTADHPQMGRVSSMTMLNYSPEKKMYTLALFDHFGGEPGIFHGDWKDDEAIVLTASFTEENGRVTHQRFTLTPVSDEEIWISRAFSDDGETYHFEVKGIYKRKK